MNPIVRFVVGFLMLPLLLGICSIPVVMPTWMARYTGLSYEICMPVVFVLLCSLIIGIIVMQGGDE